ncbi:MAG TPA: immunoglobulin domain-containing protein [Alphaproteobacteria bacterium]|nr:immunoglobulin domain-containing protein [Alphaproteobacteria bacterium]
MNKSILMAIGLLLTFSLAFAAHETNETTGEVIIHDTTDETTETTTNDDEIVGTTVTGEIVYEDEDGNFYYIDSDNNIFVLDESEFIMDVDASINETDNETEINTTTNETTNTTDNETNDDDNVTDDDTTTDDEVNDGSDTVAILGTEAETNNNQTNESISVDLYIKAPYPKGSDLVFVCDAKGFTPTRYTWYYGDEHKLLGIWNGDTYHIYGQPGNYRVTCIAENDQYSVSDTMDVNVEMAAMNNTNTTNNTNDPGITGNNNTNTTNTTTPPPSQNMSSWCADLADDWNGRVIQNGSVCSISIDSDLELDGFISIGHLVELTTGSSSSVYARGDFITVETENNITDITEAMTSRGWNVLGTADGSNRDGEDTRRIFWETSGTRDEIVNEVQTVMQMTE